MTLAKRTANDQVTRNLKEGGGRYNRYEEVGKIENKYVK